jgi:hypothetical protein
MNFLQPLIELNHSLPPDSTVDDLIVANVKRGIDEICQTKVSYSSSSFHQVEGEHSEIWSTVFASDLDSGSLLNDLYPILGDQR